MKCFPAYAPEFRKTLLMFLSMKVKLSLDFSHRFLNCDDFFNVWRREGVERELIMLYSDYREDVV